MTSLMNILRVKTGDGEAAILFKYCCVQEAIAILALIKLWYKITDKKQGRDEWWQKSVWMDKKAFKGGRHASCTSLFFPEYKCPLFDNFPKRLLLPCWNVTVVRGIFAQSMWCKENVHICACSPPRGDFNGREEWPLNVIGFRRSGLRPVCNTFMWAFNFHNAFHTSHFASLKERFLQLC